MTIDPEGCLWVAVWGAGEVRRCHPDGRLLPSRPGLKPRHCGRGRTRRWRWISGRPGSVT
ncbi:SMP-30/gluconolactonase/LRE family protein [Streptomyces collinus]|uniref:SMP-30/gluconolactonase/LRE family protein n=1 Tax=Streptomyces collinus TaxID=42684 RepID=UPI0037AB5128